MDEDDASVDNNLNDEDEDKDELEDEQEEEQDDELYDDNVVLQIPQENVSVTKQYGSLRNKQLNIPLKFFHSSESGVEQVSLESDLTDSLQKR